MTMALPLYIAEIGGNHGGNLELAKQMVAAAKNAGAGVVKFQTYISEEFVDPSHSSFSGFKEEELSARDLRELYRYCAELKIPFLSTPFDEASVELLESLPVSMVKIASGDVTNLPLVERVARMGVPVLLSIGSCNWDEADRAVATLRRLNSQPLTVLQCTAAYPAPDEDTNLLLIPEIRKRYGCDAGFSDHTLGISISLGAIALGATVVEKHFTIDRSLPGGDNDMSILPDELAMLVREGTRIRSALGTGRKEMAPSEIPLQDFLRRSLIARRMLHAEEKLQASDICIRRPGGGLSPAYLPLIIGRTCRRDIEAGQMIREDDLV